jgi:hypothetical protein
VATVLITEVLGAFHWLQRAPLILAWFVTLAVAALWLRRRPRLPRLNFRPVETVIGVVIAVIVAIVAVTAAVSPPNSADAMAYHMPRVVYWAQAGSVAFFPTPYFNQISLQPLTEYFYLHTYLLSGGDRYINLVTCAAFLAAIVGVTSLAGALGLGTRAQAFAALFCATLPNGILQASGAKNDWMLALWLVCLAYFAASRNTPFTGLALALALATKATAYLFAPPLLLAILLLRRPPSLARAAAWAAFGILLVNGPQFARNLRLTGSPLGPDSAHGDGVYRWRNEHPGLRSTISNGLRHASEQLGGRSPQWNQKVYNSVLAIHHALGMDPQDSDTTWFDGRYVPPGNANHEANANNRWHLLFIVAAMVMAAFTRRRVWILYSSGLIAAFLLFCFYLKWQQYMVRLELPLFALAAPVAAALLEALPVGAAALLCLFLLSGARLPLLDNWTRPLTGPHSLFTSSRDENYFRDMVQWDNRASYFPAVELTAATGCTRVGIDISHNQLEYPFQAMLRERTPAVRFFHTGVENLTVRYTPLDTPSPCAVLCLDCAEDSRKVALYSPVGPPVQIGRFLLFRAILPAK